jgi:hypothetical protein
VRVPWWLGLEPACADVACQDTTHRVRWAGGKLHADSHPDIEAERALAALGGAAPTCLELNHLWLQYAEDPQLITLARRPGERPLGLDGTDNVYGSQGQQQQQMAALPAPVRKQIEERFRRRTELEQLLSLPGPVIDRLMLTAFARCADRWDDDAFRAEHGLRAGAALHARAAPALRRFGARLGRGSVDATVSPSQPGAGPAFVARADPGAPTMLHAELPISWLVDVWGRGISEPEGRLILAVRDADELGREFTVDLAVWEPAGYDAWELAAIPGRVVTDEDGRWVVQETTVS